MNYAEIGLDEDEFYRSYANTWGTVGVHSSATDRRYLHPNSRRAAIVNIANETGNTGQLGQWVYRTDDLNATTANPGTPAGVQKPMVTC